MKFKLGCASAVLMFLCCDLTWCGALKNSFTKSKTTVEAQNKGAERSEGRPQISDVSSVQS